MDLFSALANGICFGPLFIGTIILTLLNHAWVYLTKKDGIRYLYSVDEPNKKILYVFSVISAFLISPILLLMLYNVQDYTVTQIAALGLWITIVSVLFGLIRIGTCEFLVNRLFLLFSWLLAIAITEYGVLTYVRTIGGSATMTADALTVIAIIIFGTMAQMTVSEESEFYEEAEEERIFPIVENKATEEKKTKNTRKKRGK